MRATLKGLHSPDVRDLWNPEILADEPFLVLLQAFFGPEGSEGEESFDFLVCNPQWLAQNVDRELIVGRHHLVVSKFDIAEITRFIERLAEECTGPDWHAIAEKLARFGHWEFEDHRH